MLRMCRNATGIEMMVYFNQHRDRLGLSPFSSLSLLQAGKASPDLIEMAAFVQKSARFECLGWKGWPDAG